MKFFKNPLVEVFLSIMQILAGLSFLGALPGSSVGTSWFSTFFGVMLIALGVLSLWNRFFSKPSAINIAISELSEHDIAEIKSLVAAGKLIPALKLVRKKTGAGLAEAKQFIEDNF